MLQVYGPGLLSLSETSDFVDGHENIQTDVNSTTLKGGSKKKSMFIEVSVKYRLKHSGIHKTKVAEPSIHELKNILKEDVIPLLNMYAPRYKILNVDYPSCIVTFKVTRKFWREYGSNFFTSVDDDGHWPVKIKKQVYFFTAHVFSA